MKRNPDDRRDNVEKIQASIDHTIQNIELTEEAMAINREEKQKKSLQAKNKRREEALEGFREEIRDEAIDKERGYK